MSRWKILLNKEIWKHVGILAGIGIVILILVFSSLNIYTHHGQGFPMPDFRGLTEVQIQDIIKSKKLHYTIVDSVHLANAPKGVVLEQAPKAGELVKKKRRVFLTINAFTQEQVSVPNLADYSYRNAREILESFGLVTGNLVYIPSEYTNLVLGQHYQGKPIEPGTMVPKGTAIDLLIGQGLSHETTPVPDLKGLDLENARTALQNLYLNIGASIYDTSIMTPEDTLKAFIWKQSPPAGEGAYLNLGASIDVWMTTNDSLLLYPEAFDVIDTTSFEDELR